MTDQQTTGTRTITTDELLHAVANSSSILDRWACLIALSMSNESHLVRELVGHNTLVGNAREALVDAVLRRFLPSIYEIGSGEIIDNRGGRSRQIDIIIARRDFPVLRFPGGTTAYPIESVLAAIEVKSVLNPAQLRRSMDNCASVGRLSPNVRSEAYRAVAKRHGMKRYPNGAYSHPDPLKNHRFQLVGRPPTFIFAFEGYEMDQSHKLANAIETWIEKTDGSSLEKLPAAISAGRCYARRNAPPICSNENFLVYVGPDPEPLRILILQLLYELSRKIPVVEDQDGIQPNLDGYLVDMVRPVTT